MKLKRKRSTGKDKIAPHITQRKQAEKELRLQRAVLESAANAIMITDREGCISWVNPAFTYLTGYTSEEVIGQNPRLLKSGKQDQSFYQSFWQTILSGQVWHGEIINRRKDGSLYTEEETITPVRDEQDRTSHFVAIKQDITLRKRSEEALGRLASFPEQNPDPVIETDLAGGVTYLNPAAENRLPDLRAVGLQHPMLDGLLSIIAALESGGEESFVREIVVDNAIYEQKVSYVPGSNLVRIFARDITKRKRAEEKIQRHRQRLATLHDIDLAITSTLDLRTLLDFLLEKVDLLLPYSATTIRLFNKESGLLEPIACRNVDEEEWKAERWKAGRGTPNLVFETRAPVITRNVQTDSRVRDPEFFRRQGLVSYLGVPLIVKKEILGVLSFYTKKEHEFSSEEVEFLSTLAGQAAIAIYNSQLYEEMKTLAGDLARS
ncbi:MAG: PAS domain S-box protein, partial [Candidatus Binatia bacterium]